jgi:hypothetical protein
VKGRGFATATLAIPTLRYTESSSKIKKFGRCYLILVQTVTLRSSKSLTSHVLTCTIDYILKDGRPAMAFLRPTKLVTYDLLYLGLVSQK